MVVYIDEGFINIADLIERITKETKNSKDKNKKKKVYTWQRLALKIIETFPDSKKYKSSIFKCCKLNEHKARIAFLDCKELNKLSSLYFFKVFYELHKKGK